KTILKYFCGLAAAVSLPMLLGAQESARINVYPDYNCRVNGFGEVQNIFGSMAMGKTGGRVDQEMRELNLTSGRTIFAWISCIPPLTTPWNARNANRKLIIPADKLPEAYEKWYQQDFPRTTDMLLAQKLEGLAKNPTKVGPGEFGVACQAGLFRKWGITSVSICIPEIFDGYAEKHPAEANLALESFWKALQKNYPGLNARFLQPFNEPNYPCWTGSFATTKEAVDTWLRVFNRFSQHMKKQAPEVSILGPCLADEAMFSFPGWDAWTVPFLKDEGHSVQYFNYHCYAPGAYTHLAWLEMLQSQGELLRKTRPQAVITEMQYKVGDVEHTPEIEKARFTYWIQQLFMALSNPDKFDTFSYFYDVMDTRGLVVEKDGKLVPNYTYYLYWVLADTRGKMLYADRPGDPEVRAFACSPSKNQLVVSVFNDSPQEKKIAVNPGMVTGNADVRLRSAYYADGVLVHAEEALADREGGLPLTLAPYGVYSIRWDLKWKSIAPSRTLDETEFYSPTVNTVFKDGLDLSIPAARQPKDTETVLLRMALSSDDLLFAEKITADLNGRKIPLFMGDSTPDLMEGSRNVWYFSVPVARALIGKENKLSLSDADTGYRLMFAALAYEEHPDSAIADSAEKESIASWKNEISSSVNATKNLRAGDTGKFDLTIRNRLAQQMEYTISIKKPDEIVFKDIAAEQKISVDPGSSRTIAGTMSLKPTEQLLESRIEVNIASSNARKKTHVVPVNLYPLRRAGKVDFPVKTDGDLSEWSQKQAATFEQDGVSTKTWLGWDKANLYVAVQVSGKFKPQRPDSMERFWANDCIEVFIDAKNKKTEMYNDDAAQIFLCPLGIKDDLPFGGRIERRKMGDAVGVVATLAEPKITIGSSVGDSGYCIEASIPWSIVSQSFSPVAGQMIGMDVAIDHMHGSDGVNLSNSVLGIKGKPFQSPAKWGAVLLE
ncbi:MAG: sugar-binding protein, partial [Victivallales bacterium]